MLQKLAGSICQKPTVFLVTLNGHSMTILAWEISDFPKNSLQKLIGQSTLTSVHFVVKLDEAFSKTPEVMKNDGNGS